MTQNQTLHGVFTACITPLQPDSSLALDDLPRFLDFLAGRGCHGSLVLGTTGEGPSFSPRERKQILQRALDIHQQRPDFRLLAGTGTPSLDETIELTRLAFDLGYDGVIVLPPYYYRKATDEGLFSWFESVIRAAVPADGAFFGYHIPSLTGVALSLDLLARLRDAFPGQFQGLKDSSADPEQAVRLGQRFGTDLMVYSGTDSLFSLALENGAAGCITAMGNLRSPDLRLVWDAFNTGTPDAVAQNRLNLARAIMDHYPPNPPLYKALLARLHGWPAWSVRLPLVNLESERLDRILEEALAAVPQFDR